MFVALAFFLLALIMTTTGLLIVPMARARPGSLLSPARGRAVATGVGLTLVLVAVCWLAQADALRDAAMGQPPGPGWDPDAGIGAIARAAGLGFFVTMLAGAFVACAFVFDLIALRRLRRAVAAAASAAPGTQVVDVGLGEQSLDRARSLEYRSNASPEVLVRGDAALGRRLLRRSAVIHGVVLGVLGVLFLGFALAIVASALG